ncbi:MAG: ATPase, partial [Clostridia bacterium]|nr:ATPase [Clostridia bacterium]
CVSETLSPTMLQFLQYKIFGRHRVPEGWIIVTAGNPPEYNKSVREFDIATMDRLRILEVQADYKVWRQYASSKGIHGAILSYLDLKKRDFYGVEASVQGKVYVTARGWEDLSEAMYLYEEEQIPVDEAVISQYLHNEKIVSQFAAYYNLYNKYKKDYQILSILEGQAGSEIKEQARQARFDERTALLGLLLEVLQRQIRQNLQEEDFLRALQGILKEVKAQLSTGKVLGQILDEELERQIEQRQALETANALSMEQRLQIRQIEAFLHTRPADFAELKAAFGDRVAELKADTSKIQAQLHNLFAFLEEVFGAGQEMLLLVTELTVNYYSVKFISSKGSEDYYRYNKELLFQERNQDIGQRMERLAASGVLPLDLD